MFNEKKLKAIKKELDENAKLSSVIIREYIYSIDDFDTLRHFTVQLFFCLSKEDRQRFALDILQEDYWWND